MHVL
jgi:hypothetical protein